MYYQLSSNIDIARCACDHNSGKTLMSLMIKIQYVVRHNWTKSQYKFIRNTTCYVSFTTHFMCFVYCTVNARSRNC